jgi:hypothetical protein
MKFMHKYLPFLIIQFFSVCNTSILFSQSSMTVATEINTTMSTGSWEQHFLSLSNQSKFEYIHPGSSELNNSIYSRSLASFLFTTATKGNTQPFTLEKTTNPYITSYSPNSSTHWYIGDRLLSTKNSAILGIEFDSTFAFEHGVLRIGDSSEKAVVLLITLFH